MDIISPLNHLIPPNQRPPLSQQLPLNHLLPPTPALGAWDADAHFKVMKDQQALQRVRAEREREMRDTQRLITGL